MGTKVRSEAEMRSYTCASSCITAAMQVIWIVRQLHQRGYAVAPYWLALFMTLFSAMTLVMFALSNEGGATVDEAWEAVNSAVWLFTELSSTSFIAQKCAAVLKVGCRQIIPITRPCSRDSPLKIMACRSSRRNRPHRPHILRVKTASQSTTLAGSLHLVFPPTNTTPEPRRAVTVGP